MAAEKETGYEPSLLIEMEKVFNEVRGKYVRRATVIKDRFSQIDSKQFENPKFESFLPHIKMLNLGGEHVGVDSASSGRYARLSGYELLGNEAAAGYLRRGDRGRVSQYLSRAGGAREEMESGYSPGRFRFASVVEKSRISRLKVCARVWGSSSSFARSPRTPR